MWRSIWSSSSIIETWLWLNCSKWSQGMPPSLWQSPFQPWNWSSASLWSFVNVPKCGVYAFSCGSMSAFIIYFPFEWQNGDLLEIRTLLEIFISPDDDETHFFSNYACIPLVQVAAAIRHWYALEKNSDHMWWMCVRSGNVGSHKEMWGGTIQDE